MLLALYGSRVESVKLHDIRGIDSAKLGESLGSLEVRVVNSWQEAYRESDIVFTCTSSTARYIDEAPLPGSLLMNISLREYLPESVQGIKAIVVDKWQEVCRENTDIEHLHRETGLSEGDTLSLSEVIHGGALQRTDASEPVFFNPMGMAAFDMAIAAFYWREAERLGVGVRLED
jgi:ornithine cyclodeaminase